MGQFKDRLALTLRKANPTSSASSAGYLMALQSSFVTATIKVFPVLGIFILSITVVRIQADNL